MKNLRIFLAVGVVLEILLSTRGEYQTALQACATQECISEYQAKIEIVQREIDGGDSKVAVGWSDIVTAVIPTGGQ
jgi:hypothetical protein